MSKLILVALLFGTGLQLTLPLLGQEFWRQGLYRNRKLTIDAAQMPTSSQCEESQHLTSWTIDVDEFENEFSELKKAICLTHRQSVPQPPTATRHKSRSMTKSFGQSIRAWKKGCLPATTSMLYYSPPSPTVAKQSFTIMATKKPWPMAKTRLLPN